MLIQGLNTVQSDAVQSVNGPILVVAGAGSGKTRVLTHRIANLIESHDVFPSKIMAITFTNKAASEMKSRIESLVGPVTNQMWVGTFHAICVRILRRDGHLIGYGNDFVIYDTTDQKALLKACYKALNIDEKNTPVKHYQYKISSAKNDMISADRYEKEFGGDFREKEFIKVYQLYQDKLLSSQAMDFDDILIKTIELFKKSPETLAYYQNRFQYIHVDEYQDTNKAQYELIKCLSEKHHNLFVVGDGDQSIYRWRGADVRNIREFERDYSGAVVFKLEQNYRSTKNILDLANSVIKHNPNRREKNLWTDSAEGDKIQYFGAYDEKDEARFVVDQIQKRVREDGYTLSDFAILYRTNAQSRSFEDALMYQGLNYRVIGGSKFYDRKEIKDLMAYLKLIVNPFDDVSFTRVINEPKRSIGEKTLQKLQDYADAAGISLLGSALQVEHIDGITGKAQQGIREFAEIIASLTEMVDTHFISQIFDQLVEKTGVIRSYELERTTEADGRIDNIYEFKTVIEEFEKRAETPSLRDFLAETSLRSDQDSIDETQEGVLLMTLHASKGLEFPVVFLVGLEDQLFPSFRSMDDDEAMEEERRLCYVGITRAEKLLHVTHAKHRNLFGRFEARQPSVFLSEMDLALMEGVETRVEKAIFTEPKKKTSSFFQLKKAPSMPTRAPEPKVSTESIQMGDKVMHKVFGTGMVIAVAADGDLMTIVFDDHGIKKLSSAVAPIKKIG